MHKIVAMSKLRQCEKSHNTLGFTFLSYIHLPIRPTMYNGDPIYHSRMLVYWRNMPKITCIRIVGYAVHTIFDEVLIAKIDVYSSEQRNALLEWLKEQYMIRAVAEAI